ncbi:MAG: hypothetical protein EOP84_20310, partial [Verrucomicrobiaceae bacterium]
MRACLQAFAGWPSGDCHLTGCFSHNLDWDPQKRLPQESLFPISQAQTKTASVSMIYLILVYLFITMAELCISPVGLSYVSKLVPA